jgi:hypothetical protein
MSRTCYLIWSYPWASYTCPSWVPRTVPQVLKEQNSDRRQSKTGHQWPFPTPKNVVRPSCKLVSSHLATVTIYVVITLKPVVHLGIFTNFGVLCPVAPPVKHRNFSSTPRRGVSKQSPQCAPGAADLLFTWGTCARPRLRLWPGPRMMAYLGLGDTVTNLESQFVDVPIGKWPLVATSLGHPRFCCSNLSFKSQNDHVYCLNHAKFVYKYE